MGQSISTLLQRPEVGGQRLQRRCFVSSSMRNREQVRRAVDLLMARGVFVYDFTQNDLLGMLREANVQSFAEGRALVMPTAEADITMLNSMGAADFLLLILPAGFSAGWETGYATARGAQVVVCTEGGEINDVPLLHAHKICPTLIEAVEYIAGA